MNKKTKTVTRRNFIRNSSIGISGAIVAPTILKSCASGAAPSDLLQLAHIGVGSRGQQELKSYFLPIETSQSVAACDPFKQRREAVAYHINKTYKERNFNAPECKSYQHFEEILERINNKTTVS